MPYSAIIAEYDPFHSGHEYHIKATKAAGNDGVAVIMSGNFTQRGYPAIIPREYRAEAAISGGADLVIELPAPWSCSSAEVFARGAVGIVDSLGIFDTLSFGSAADKTEEITALAFLTSSEEFFLQTGKELKNGISYPRAACEAIRNISNNDHLCSLLEDANAMLACEYIKALNKLSSGVKPLNIKRIGAPHGADTPMDGYASASMLRECIYNNYNFNPGQCNLDNLQKYMSEEVYSIVIKAYKEGACPVDMEKFGFSSLCILRTLSADDIGKAFASAEGLENRIYKAVRQSVSFTQAADKAKTKRFTHARIRRIMLSAYLGSYSSFNKENVPYARVIALNKRGCEMLRAADKKSRIPVLTKIPKSDKLSEKVRKVFEFNAKAEDLYNLCLPCPRECGTYYTSKLIKL